MELGDDGCCSDDDLCRFSEGGRPSRLLFEVIFLPMSGVSCCFVRREDDSLAERCDCCFKEGLGRLPCILSLKGDLPSRTLFTVVDATESVVGVFLVLLDEDSTADRCECCSGKGFCRLPLSRSPRSMDLLFALFDIIGLVWAALKMFWRVFNG